VSGALTINQHVFPRRSLARFGDTRGKVRVCILKTNSVISNVSPGNKGFFCAKRIWDQRAERYMKQIEDAFQTISDRIEAGSASLNLEDHGLISRFFALWHLRADRKTQPEPDFVPKAVTGFPKQLQEELGEALEKAGVLFIRHDGTIPGRVMLGMHLQKHIDVLMDTHCSQTKWGIFKACNGEFIVPDYIPLHLQLVPVSPTYCLAAGHDNSALVEAYVSQVNSSLTEVAKEHIVARDFTKCPRG
jgi:hypothetical protein